MNFYKNKNNWLVTGGSGFIGSHLIDCLINSNQLVTCVDDYSSGHSRNLKKNKRLNIINKKTQDLSIKDLKNNFKGIFHLAAQPSAPKSIENMFLSSSNNLLSTLKVWEIAKELKIPVVYASSSAIYGDLPIGNDQSKEVNILSPYALDKLTMEKYAKLSWDLYSISSIGLRFFNVYGPRQDPSNPYSGVISIFIDRLLNDKNIILNGGWQTRDFIYVSDVCKVLLNCMSFSVDNKICEVYNVGTGRSITIKHLLSILSDILKITPKFLIKELSKGDPEVSNCKTEKLNKRIEIRVKEFYSLEQGLKETLEYLKG